MAAQVEPHHAIVPAERRHPGIETLGVADGGMQQQQRVGLAPWIGEVVDVVGEPDAVAGRERVDRHAVLSPRSPKTLAAPLGTVKLTTMIIDRIDPLALRIPAPGGNALCLTLSRVVTRDGVEGYGECLSLRPPMQRALYATIRDAIA